MPINKQIKGVAGLLALLSISTAIGITEWRSGHPIGSFAESFIAVALLLSSFIFAVVVGVKTKNRLDSSRNLYRASKAISLIFGIACLLACFAVLYFIPGVSEALDRIQKSSG